MVGTDPACDLVLDEPTVSGHHCRLTRFEDGYTLEDLGSTNGTFVDDVRLPPRRPMRVAQGAARDARERRPAALARRGR